MAWQLYSIPLQELSSCVLWDSDAAETAELMEKKMQPQESKQKKRANHTVSLPFQHMWQMHNVVKEIIEVKTLYDAFCIKGGLIWCITESAANECYCLILENGLIKDLGKKWN